MAEQPAKNEETKKPKRRLKSTPTLREQTAKQTTETKKPRVKNILLVPFKLFFRLVKAVALFITSSPPGRLIKAIWKSRIFIPIRFIFKIIGKILFLSYFRNSWKELRLVSWPNASTTWRLTGAVLVFGLVFGLMVAGLDFVLEKGFREVLLR